MKYGFRQTVTAAAAVLYSLLLPLAAGAVQTTPPEAAGPPAGLRAAIDPNDPTLRRISNRLKCQCGGCTASVQSCPHQMDCGLRMYILNTIKNGLAAGKTEEQIIASMVTEYGPQILLEPPREGFSLLGWVMPFAALLAGALAVGIVLWRWKAGQQQPAPQVAAAAPAQSPAPDVVEKFRAQIDRELERDEV